MLGKMALCRLQVILCVPPFYNLGLRGVGTYPFGTFAEPSVTSYGYYNILVGTKSN